VLSTSDKNLYTKNFTGSEGRYAAGFSFFLKLANSLGLLVTGYILKSVGYVSGAESQAPAAINNLAVITFVAGPILMAISFLVLRLYPLTHAKMSELREQYDAKGDSSSEHS
jgi:Na+/melibiose symporter-like transporter